VRGNRPPQRDSVRGMRHGPSDGPAADMTELRRTVDLRQQALERLRLMSLKHAANAWQRRNSDPIAPFGLAFLYAQPGPDASKPWLTVSAATKLWLDGDDTADLPRLLFTLNQTLSQHLDAPQPFDVRSQLANRTDPTMTANAWYVGLGISSLDTSAGTWRQAVGKVDSDFDIPSVVRIVLIDGTITIAKRLGASDFHQLRIVTTQPLSIGHDLRFLTWTAVSDQDLRADPEHAMVLRWMEELHTTLWRLDLAGSTHTKPQ
jgi:hypothetical protein